MGVATFTCRPSMVEQGARQIEADVVERLADGGQRRRQVGGNRNVVEADQRDILRDTDATPEHHHAGAHCALVVGGKYGGEGLAAVEQSGHRQHAAGFKKIALENEVGVHFQIEFAVRANEAGVTVDRVFVIARPTDVGDAPVAHGQQMMRGEITAVFIVQLQCLEIAALKPTTG